MSRNELVNYAIKHRQDISVHLGNNIMKTLFKERNIENRDIHKFFMGKLTAWNRQAVSEKTCFDKYYYWLDYPICWFRSLAFMFMMDETHRKMLLEHNKDKTYKDKEDVLVRLNEYIVALMTYIETGIYNNSYQEPGTKIKHSLHWIYYNFLPEQQEQRISMDDCLLWLLYCMSEAKVNFINIKTIRGFNALFYVKNMYYNGNIAALDVPSAYHHCLKNETLTISIDAKPGGGSVSRILVKYFLLSFTNAKNARLALFVRHNNRVYTLSSLTITSYIKTWSSLMVGHQFCIYKCNRKFYQEDSEVMNNLSEVQLLSDMLLDIDLAYRPASYHFYANKSNRAALYTPSLFIFSEEECNLLEHMSRVLKKKKEPGSSSCLGFRTGAKVGVQGCNDTLYILSCLVYFAKSLTVVIANDERNTWTFWTSLSYVERSFIMTFYAQQTANPTTIVEICKSSLNDSPAHIQTTWLRAATVEKTLTSLPQGLFKITAMSPSNVMQIDALRHIFSMVNMYVYPPSSPQSQPGGAQRTHIMINDVPNKKYKVCIDKSKRKYITINRRRVFLSEIKGKYKYMR